MKQVKVFYRPDGSVDVDVSGTKGKECLNISKALEEFLGPLENRKLKPEYYETNTTQKVTQDN